MKSMKNKIKLNILILTHLYIISFLCIFEKENRQTFSQNFFDNALNRPKSGKDVRYMYRYE